MVCVMKLTFIYAPVADLNAAIAHYRDVLGLDESWREGDHTVAFQLPDTDVQIMVSVDEGAAGPMYLVDDVAAFIEAHPKLEVAIPHTEIPDGHRAGFVDPAGNLMYVLDQTGAA
jgi:predicted enzyme related to lactoylglutathione lyase